MDKPELGKDAPLCLTGLEAIWIIPNHHLLDTEVSLGILNGPDARNSPRLRTQTLAEQVMVGIATKKVTIAVKLVHKVIDLHNLLWEGGKVRYCEEK